MNYLHTPRRILCSTDDGGGGGGGGGDTQSGGGGGDTQGGGGGDTQSGGGGGATDWFSTLSDDLKGEVAVTRHKSLDDMVRAGLAAERRLGVPADKVLKLPDKLDDVEALSAISKALGAPEKPDGYNFQFAEGTTDADKAAVTDFAKAMHEKGLGATPFIQQAVAWFTGKVADQAAADKAAADTAHAEATTALKTEWGAKFDENSKAIGKLVHDLGGEALAAEFDASKLGNNPEMAKMLAKIAGMRAESGANNDGQGARVDGGKLTPGEARFKRVELENDMVKGKALRDGSHPMHQAVVQERARLLAFENPEEAKA